MNPCPQKAFYKITTVYLIFDLSNFRALPANYLNSKVAIILFHRNQSGYRMIFPIVESYEYHKFRIQLHYLTAVRN